jgi:hypothetical protein
MHCRLAAADPPPPLVAFSSKRETLPKSFGRFAQALAQPEDAQWLLWYHDHGIRVQQRQSQVSRAIDDIYAHPNSIFREGNGARCYFLISSVWRRKDGSIDDIHDHPRAARSLGHFGGVTFKCNHAGQHKHPCRERNHRDGSGFSMPVRFRADQSNANTTNFEITRWTMMHSGHLSPTIALPRGLAELVGEISWVPWARDRLTSLASSEAWPASLCRRPEVHAVTRRL